MWNPLKKKSNDQPGASTHPKGQSPVGGPDTKDLTFMQKFAMKRLEKMSPAERQKMMQKALNPKNIQKHKGEIMGTLDAMKKSGQMSDDQYRLAKKRFGL
jgi:hypothetical protein